MEDFNQGRRWFWLTLLLSSVTIVGLVFALWELLESHFFRDVDYLTLHYLYVSRGIVSSFLLAFWAAWFVLRERRASEQQLRRSRERYRGLLEASPGAVALYSADLIVDEWNAAAEQLYGYRKEEVLGSRLPIVTGDQERQLRVWMGEVSTGKQLLEAETQRQAKCGRNIDVQLSLLLFREALGPPYFLEVSNDIRERIKLRQTLLQVEKLTTMGQMAAGTAHHLNTPLASMLLRASLARKRASEAGLNLGLDDLEDNIRHCQQFVRKLLDFSRRPQAVKQAESVGSTLESVLGFITPQAVSRGVRLQVDVHDTNGSRVLADRNQLEALFLILLTNSLDAVTSGGEIWVRSHQCDDRVEVEVEDNGCGIDQAQLRHVFEPFFTTKPIGKGTGLGLAIANNILQEHGGTIRIQSSPGQGTRAVVTLPLRAGAHKGGEAHEETRK